MPDRMVAPGSADGQKSVELINQLAALRRPTKSPSQLVHGDLYGTALFALAIVVKIVMVQVLVAL